MTDRRRYRRLNAPVYWRVSGLRSAFKPVDVSVGGMRMYSDDAFEVGARFELEVLVHGEEPVEFDVRVVWIETLPAGAPARYDVGLQFLELSDTAKHHLSMLLSE
ncbi:MAG TPA: PilZ domain-containing protein [Polyangiaceae bacterium]|nr:PilZ domain-containing protein [Polyangiaceae bacterium]